MRSHEEFPFCSERCRAIDLGKWASGAYRISSPMLDPETAEDVDMRKLDPSENDAGEEPRQNRQRPN